VRDIQNATIDTVMPDFRSQEVGFMARIADSRGLGWAGWGGFAAESSGKSNIGT